MNRISQSVTNDKRQFPLDRVGVAESGLDRRANHHWSAINSASQFENIREGRGARWQR
jgi:hypothetical protein